MERDGLDRAGVLQIAESLFDGWVLGQVIQLDGVVVRAGGKHLAVGVEGDFVDCLGGQLGHDGRYLQMVVERADDWPLVARRLHLGNFEHFEGHVYRSAGREFA